MTQEPLNLSHYQPVANGSSRWVYLHPHQAGFLIKVLKNKLPAQQVYGLKNRLKALKGRHKLTRHMREIEQYITVKSCRDDKFIHHLPMMTALYDTDMGFGIVVEAITDADGQLAPTLTDIIKAGQMTMQRITLLELFFERLLKSDVVAGDVHGKNIVLETQPEGTERFVLVDGLGDSTIVPTRALSWWINRYKKIEGIKKQRKRYTARLSSKEFKKAASLQCVCSFFNPYGQ